MRSKVRSATGWKRSPIAKFTLLMPFNAALNFAKSTDRSAMSVAQMFLAQREASKAAGAVPAQSSRKSSQGSKEVNSRNCLADFVSAGYTISAKGSRKEWLAFVQRSDAMNKSRMGYRATEARQRPASAGSCSTNFV